MPSARYSEFYPTAHIRHGAIVPQVPHTLLVSAADTADLWLAENDPQGVAFENEVLE